MIVGSFKIGSGLGNMLHRYIATRVLAADLGVPFGMDNHDNFKGKDFMPIDMGKHPQWLQHQFQEQRVNNEQGVDIRPYDERVKDIKDHTRIDGEFQDFRYFGHRLDEVREWLKVEPLEMPDDVCVISFRAGEYRGIKELFLEQSYWDNAIENIKKINPDMSFVVHTDDVETAQSFFPNFQCIHDIGLNWRAIRYAHYLIVSNSSFSIIPSLLNENVKKIIAPKYHARHNISDGYWAMEQNIYEQYTYQDRGGELSDYDTCIKELKEYNSKYN